jgi:ribosomal protein S18 acetylase RimI-like enzyme
MERVIQPAPQRQEAGEAVVLLALLTGFPCAHLLCDLCTKAPEEIATIWHVAVWGPLQGLGIGSRLMQAAEEEIARRGFRWSQLGVEKTNAAAHRLYERLGYVAFGEEDEVWPEPAADGRLIPVTHPCWLLRKDLRAAR